jgi:hypothetical protein
MLSPCLSPHCQVIFVLLTFFLPRICLFLLTTFQTCSSSCAFHLSIFTSGVCNEMQLLLTFFITIHLINPECFKPSMDHLKDVYRNTLIGVYYNISVVVQG